MEINRAFVRQNCGISLPFPRQNVRGVLAENGIHVFEKMYPFCSQEFAKIRINTADHAASYRINRGRKQKVRRSFMPKSVEEQIYELIGSGENISVEKLLDFMEMNDDALNKEQREYLNGILDNILGAGPIGRKNNFQKNENAHPVNAYDRRYEQGRIEFPDSLLRDNSINMLSDINRLRQALRDSRNDREKARALEIRIQGLEKIRELEENARQRKVKRLAGVPLIRKNNESILLDQAEQPRQQDTTNGCWSVSLQTQLGYRGVSLDQQAIRAFRPNPDEFREVRGINGNQEFNSDAANDMSNYASLVHKVLPNTCVKYVSFFEGTDRLEGLRTHIQKALREDNSPVSFVVNNHFRTIIGMDQDTLFIKDPLQDGTQKISLTELSAKPYDIGLYWLKDMEPTLDGRIPEENGWQMDYCGGHLLNTDNSGTVSVDNYDGVNAIHNLVPIELSYRRQKNQSGKDVFAVNLDALENNRQNLLNEIERLPEKVRNNPAVHTILQQTDGMVKDTRPADRTNMQTLSDTYGRAVQDKELRQHRQLLDLLEKQSGEMQQCIRSMDYFERERAFRERADQARQTCESDIRKYYQELTVKAPAVPDKTYTEMMDALGNAYRAVNNPGGKLNYDHLDKFQEKADRFLEHAAQKENDPLEQERIRAVTRLKKSAGEFRDILTRQSQKLDQRDRENNQKKGILRLEADQNENQNENRNEKRSGNRKEDGNPVIDDMDRSLFDLSLSAFYDSLKKQKSYFPHQTYKDMLTAVESACGKMKKGEQLAANDIRTIRKSAEDYLTHKRERINEGVTQSSSDQGRIALAEEIKNVTADYEKFLRSRDVKKMNYKELENKKPAKTQKKKPAPKPQEKKKSRGKEKQV